MHTADIWTADSDIREFLTGASVLANGELEAKALRTFNPLHSAHMAVCCVVILSLDERVSCANNEAKLAKYPP